MSIPARDTRARRRRRNNTLAWLAIGLAFAAATSWVLPAGLVQNERPVDARLDVYDIDDSASVGFYFRVDMASPRSSARMWIDYLGPDQATSAPIVSSARRSLIESCQAGSQSLPVTQADDGRYTIAFPPADRFVINCDISSVLQRELTGWSITTPTVTRHTGGGTDNTPPKLGNCLVKTVLLTGFSEAATLTLRPTPIRQPVSEIEWTARTASDGNASDCRFATLSWRYLLEKWVQDGSLVTDLDWLHQPPMDHLVEIGATTVSVQEPQLTADTNARLFLGAVLASMATSAVFLAAQAALDRGQPGGEQGTQPVQTGLETSPRRSSQVFYLAVVLTVLCAARKTNKTARNNVPGR